MGRQFRRLSDRWKGGAVEHDEGLFCCPRCFQKYDVGGEHGVPIQLVQEHLGKHGIQHDKRWIKRRLKPRGEELASA